VCVCVCVYRNIHSNVCLVPASRDARPLLPERRPDWRELSVRRLQGAAGGGATVSGSRPPARRRPPTRKVRRSSVTVLCMRGRSLPENL